MLQWYNVTMLQCNYVTMWLCYNMTILQYGNVTILKCYTFTTLQQNFNVITLQCYQFIWEKHLEEALGDVYIVKTIC